MLKMVGPWVCFIMWLFPLIVTTLTATNVTVTATFPTEIYVSWGSVPQNITMYEVCYQPQETFNGAIQAEAVNVSGSELTAILMNLEEYVNYTISVRAYTIEGEGPYSERVIVLTNEGGNLSL